MWSCLLAVVNSEHGCVGVCHVPGFSLVSCTPGRHSWVLAICVCDLWRNRHTFPQPLLDFLVLPAMHRRPRFSTSSPVCAISQFLTVATLAAVRCYLWFSSALPQQLMMPSTFSSICWLFVCLWRNVIFQVLAHFCTGLFLLFVWGSILYILNVESFPVSDWQVFSPGLQCQVAALCGGSSWRPASQSAGGAVWHATGKGVWLELQPHPSISST